MTTEQIKVLNPSVLQKIREYLTGIKSLYKSREVCARQAGLKSAGAWYDFINQRWEKVSKESFDRMATKAGVTGNWQMVNTVNLKKITDACIVAQQLKSLYAIVGETGTGKTGACEHIAAERKGMVYVMGDILMSRTGFIDKMLKAMGCITIKESLESKMTRICHNLMMRECPLLVIDDAGKLKESVLQLVQVLFDRTKGRVGMLLIGTEQLYTKIVKHTETNRFYMRELMGRIGHWETLNYVTAKDIGKICTENGIGDATAIQWLNNATVSLHTLKNMVEKAREYQSVTGQTVTGAVLAEMNGKYKWFDTKFINFEKRMGAR